MILKALYDDEPGEPDQAIRDLLTDTLHEAQRRGVDIDQALERAHWMQNQELAEWDLRSRFDQDQEQEPA